MDEIAKRLLSEYINSGYSYPDLEKLTGISKSTLQRYFTGETEKIPLSSLERIAKAFNVDPAYLMGWKQRKTEDSQNGDIMALRERLRRQPGMRILFDATKNATEQDLLDAVMPPDLRRAHQDNDRAVWEAYGRAWPIGDEAACVAHLMKMYQEKAN